jgi:DNA invertase Pin-like site-specific DNA recombinase
VIIIGYVRVSTVDQAESGAGLQSQRNAIQAECNRHGWQLLRIDEDAASGGKMQGRPGLASALESVEAGEAQGLMVAKLDRLSRSLLDFAAIADRARSKGWALMALDLNLDTSTAAGELIANVMASVAQWERRAIGQRTRDALAIKKAEGVRLGRPPAIPASVTARLGALRDEGLSDRAIARAMNDGLVPTAHGGQAWHGTTVARALARETS